MINWAQFLAAGQNLYGITNMKPIHVVLMLSLTNLIWMLMLCRDVVNKYKYRKMRVLEIVNISLQPGREDAKSFITCMENVTRLTKPLWCRFIKKAAIKEFRIFLSNYKAFSKEGRDLDFYIYLELVRYMAYSF